MKQRILVIDDDPLVLRSILSLLRSVGYEVEGTKNSEEALNKAISVPCDLVISDIRMPGDDGIVTIKKIKQTLREKRKLEVPFLFITGYASEDAPIDAMKLGADDYILKPFDNDQFLAAVKKSLEKPRRLTSVEPSIQIICSNIKDAVREYHDKHEEEIFDNEELRKLFKALEDGLALIEKEVIESE